MGKEAASARWMLWTILLFMCKEFSCDSSRPQTFEDDTTLRDPIRAKLALGGMIQAMLLMQIRPQGGFYEESYKNLPAAGASNLTGDLNSIDSSLATSTRRLVEDGKLLEATSKGLADSPCFEIERLVQNRLLALLCSMRLKKELSPEKQE